MTFTFENLLTIWVYSALNLYSNESQIFCILNTKLNSNPWYKSMIWTYERIPPVPIVLITWWNGLNNFFVWIVLIAESHFDCIYFWSLCSCDSTGSKNIPFPICSNPSHFPYSDSTPKILSRNISQVRFCNQLRAPCTKIPPPRRTIIQRCNNNCEREAYNE